MRCRSMEAQMRGNATLVREVLSPCSLMSILSQNAKIRRLKKLKNKNTFLTLNRNHGKGSKNSNLSKRQTVAKVSQANAA